MSPPTLILVAHGTREPAGAQVAQDIAAAVAVEADVPVALAFADVRPPRLADVLSGIDGPAVVVPAFLAAGYHVRVDIPAQLAATGRTDVRLARSPGPADALVSAVRDRLVQAGWRTGDGIVLAAAGSSDPRALSDVRTAAGTLAAFTGTTVRIGYLTTARPTVPEAVAAARTAHRRVAVASWLLAPGLFHRWASGAGADLVSAPIGAHPGLVEHIVARYREQVMATAPR